MRTNELIEKAEAMGFEVVEHPKYIDLYCDKIKITDINKYKNFSVNTDYVYFHKLNEDKKQKLFNLLIKYSSTPIEERTEEKKYMYHTKKVDGLQFNVKYLQWVYLDFLTPEGYKGYFIVDYQIKECKKQFTHSWLEKHGVNIKQLQEVYDEIEVKE